jgi:hypothetical protein
MSVEKLKLKNLRTSITINKVSWCYVEGNKVIIVHEVRDSLNRYLGGVQIKIPFRIIKKWFK